MRMTSPAFRHLVVAVFAICGIVLALPIFQWANAAGSLSKLYHPDPIPDIKHPQFSPDGSDIAFTICNPCKIAICSITTERSVILTPQKGSTIFDATFDPRSNGVAFVLSKELPNGSRDYQIAVSQIDGTRLRTLTSSDTHKRFPAYSFDGSKILFEGKDPCKKDTRKYCAADLYEYDFNSQTERRITDFQALQVGPAFFLPGNGQIALTAFGSVIPRGKIFAERVDIQAVYGDKPMFVTNASEPNHLQQLVTNTPTASSPKPLPSGEIAFLSRVNKYDNVKAGYVYDVFLWNEGNSRRLTNLSRYIREYGISNTAQSLAFVTESNDKPAKAELLLWNVADGSSRKLECGSSVEERSLVPSQETPPK